MPRYGTFRYGEYMYGEGGTTTNLIWALEIDWDGDGVFDGRNDAMKMKSFSFESGRTSFLSIGSDGVASGFQPFNVGRATITLDNEDQTYNPYNTSSELYPNVERGKYARLKVFNGTTDTTGAYIINGIMTDIRMTGERGKLVTLKIENGMQLLADADVSIDLQTNLTIDAAVAAILTEVGYPWSSNLDASSLTVPFWWSNGKALNEINKLARSGLGAFFVQADGTARYITPQDVTDPVTTLTSDYFAKEIPLPQPYEVTRNLVKLTVHPREEQAISTLWQAPNVVTLAPGEEHTFWASYSYGIESPVPASSVVSPVVGTDYTFMAGSTNITNSLGVTFTNFGSTAKIVVVNDHATLTGTLTTMKVRGTAVASPDAITIKRSTGAANRALVMDLEWVQSVNDADDFATYLLAWLSSVKAFPTVTMEGHPEVQFSLDLYDVVTLDITYLGISANYRVANITHESISENAQGVRSVFYLEPLPTFISSDFWTFPTELGVTSILGFSG